jgi:hypothetical protein
MPESHAASWLLPIASRYRPKVVFCVKKAPANTIASRMITGSARRRKVQIDDKSNNDYGGNHDAGNSIRHALSRQAIVRPRANSPHVNQNNGSHCDNRNRDFPERNNPGR